MYSYPLALFLWFISGFGALGFHRFYLGKPLSGLLWMFTGGLCMLGSVFDLFTLRSQVDEANMRRFIRGGAAFGAGAAAAMREVRDGESRVLNRQESQELAILRLARKNHGLVTASEAAIEAGIPLDEAKKQLEAMVNKGHAELRVRQSGALIYAFPEFMDDSGLEDF